MSSSMRFSNKKMRRVPPISSTLANRGLLQVLLISHAPHEAFGLCGRLETPLEAGDDLQTLLGGAQSLVAKALQHPLPAGLLLKPQDVSSV